MNNINETFEPQRISPSEVAEIHRRARYIVWWDLNFPIAYRYGKKFLKYVGIINS